MSEIDKTLQERGSRYGDFTDHAAICDALIHQCQGTGVVATNFQELDPVKKQAIRVICDKLARILSPGGDPEYRDNWHGIQGYAKLAEDRCKDGDAAAQEELPLADAVAKYEGYRELSLDSGFVDAQAKRRRLARLRHNASRA